MQKQNKGPQPLRRAQQARGPLWRGMGTSVTSPAAGGRRPSPCGEPCLLPGRRQLCRFHSIQQTIWDLPVTMATS